MRRTDTLLVIVVGALAVFVARQITTAPHPRPVEPKPAAPEPTAPVASQGTPTATPAAIPAAQPSAPTDTQRTGHDPRRDVAGTYFSEMVTDLNGQLVRWSDRREQGLRIWVQSATTVHDWDVRYAQMARDAFDDWGSAGLPLRFDFILDSASSDVQIVWSERFPPELGRRVGNTTRTNDQHGWLSNAQITVAIHDSTGRTISPNDLVGIVRHEAGHALGLGHSMDPKTKMYPTETVHEITPADRATLRLLYQLPPGAVR